MPISIDPIREFVNRHVGPDDRDRKNMLEALGVEVLTGCRVTAIDAGGVTMQAPQGEQRLAARTVLWAAGVAASPLGRLLAQA